MRFQLMTLIVLAAISVHSMSASTAWSQDDPFAEGGAGDPFGSAVKRVKTPQPTPNNSVSNRAVRLEAVGSARTSGPPADRVQPVRVALVNESESVRRIEAALGDETAQSFVDIPLIEAVQTISELHDIPIVVDVRALEEIGLASETPVTIDLHNVSLRSFMRLMLRDLDLTYVVKDEVLQITTKECSDMDLATRMYPMPEVLARNSDKVLEAIKSTIVPDTWSIQGGPSAAMTIDHVMIVSTTSDVHHQVENFLNTLIETYSE